MKKLLLSSLLGAFAMSAHAQTERMSVTQANVEANGSSLNVRSSDDGRFVVFTTNATNLIPNDTNVLGDIVLKDRQTGALTCMSCLPDGTVGTGASTQPSLSGDGRFVAFQSAASNLVTGDTNGAIDVFVREIASGVISRVNLDSNGMQTITGTSGQARLSQDGRFVSFASLATNLVSGDTNSVSDIFIRDRQASTTTRVSLTAAGAQTDGASTAAAMSADGNYIVFTSAAANITLPAEPSTLTVDVFLRDRVAGTTERLTSSAATNGTCFDPAISADASVVAFNCPFTDLVPNDTNAARDVFYRARTGSTLARVTAPGGVEANGATENPSLNRNGTLIAVFSTATNLIAADTNATTDVFVVEPATGAIIRASVASDGTEGSGGVSTFPWLAADGNVVVFNSGKNNLVTNDTNATVDTFARVLPKDQIFGDGFE
jgi:Tol biopolymer transport system component